MIVDDASASMEDHHRREWSRALRSIELGLRAAVGAADFAGVKSKRYIRPGCNTRNGNDQQKGAESEADHASILAKTSGSSRPGSQAHRRLGDKPLERVPLTRNHVIAGGAPLEDAPPACLVVLQPVVGLSENPPTIVLSCAVCTTSTSPRR